VREYRYSALDGSGRTVTGVRRAPDGRALMEALQEQGLVLLRSRPTWSSLLGPLAAGGRPRRGELRAFTQHMATCLAAGIPLLSALEDFQRESGGAMAAVVREICNDVSSGTPLDEALARHPDVFPTVYLAMIKVGLNSGRLDETFGELVGYLEWTDNLRSQVGQAMIYPAILFTGIIGLFLLLAFFVMPRFTAVFESVDFELPALTVRMLSFGNFLGHWWWLLGGTTVLLVLALKRFSGTDRGAYLRDRLLLRMPVVGAFVHKIALSRFTRTFAMLYATGLDLMKLLELSQGVVGNRVMARELAEVRDRVATGESLSACFSGARIFPPLVQRMIHVGEQSGSLDTSLLNVARYLEKEIPKDLKKAFTLFEALIIAILGLLVGIAALSLLMPIMQLSSAVR